jgi:Fur family transcriptional regulator, peroxide stress response regulator
MSLTTLTRDSKYTKEITKIIDNFGHATNAGILLKLQAIYPDVSATTVHRSTSRLAERGLIAVAPPDNQGSMRYDANTNAHDHFICNYCGGIRDLEVADKLIPTISKALGGCKITGRLLIHGSCETCVNKQKGEIK